MCSLNEKYMQKNKSTHKILRGSTDAYVNGVVPICKDLH